MKRPILSTVPWRWLSSTAILYTALWGTASVVRADVKLPAIFGSHMVLQQGQPNRVWGQATAGENVSVAIAGQTKTATAGADGKWTVQLDALPVGGPHQLTVQGANTITLEDVLVGEVWVCSGQSNMQWQVSASKDPDLEIRTANYPSDPFDHRPASGDPGAPVRFCRPMAGLLAGDA